LEKKDVPILVVVGVPTDFGPNPKRSRVPNGTIGLPFGSLENRRMGDCHAVVSRSLPSLDLNQSAAIQYDMRDHLPLTDASILDSAKGFSRGLPVKGDGDVEVAARVDLDAQFPLLREGDVEPV